MGNRATVIFTDGNGSFSPAVYLHWNGGPESIYGFLNEMDRRHIRTDQYYECARFIHIVGDFFDQDEVDGLSLGVTNAPKSATLKDLEKVDVDYSDNGLYLVNRVAKPLKMRRFKEGYKKDKSGEMKCFLKEMSGKQVEQEYTLAMKSDYISSFKETFEEITKGKEINTY